MAGVVDSLSLAGVAEWLAGVSGGEGADGAGPRGEVIAGQVSDVGHAGEAVLEDEVGAWVDVADERGGLAGEGVGGHIEAGVSGAE